MDEIELVPYDSAWPALFAAVERLLRKSLDPALLLDIQHFGSTSIPGLAATLAHPAEAHRYEALKRKLADKYATDREAYRGEGREGLR